MSGGRSPRRQVVEPKRRAPRFRLTLEGRGGSADIHGLRSILKYLLRRHRFRCIDATEEREP
jgi:hypothetical protein